MSHRAAGLGAGIACLTFLVGCSGDGPSRSTWSGTVDSLSDTIIITTDSRSFVPTIQVRTPVDTLLAGEDLNRPNVAAIGSDSTWYVADGTVIYRLVPHGPPVRMGRKGGGPGEFLSINGVTAWGTDSLLVWDGTASRLTWLDSAGRALRTLSVSPDPKYATPRNGPLWPANAGANIGFSTGLITPNGPSDSVVVNRVDLATGSSTRVAVVGSIAWKNAGGIMGPVDPFGPKGLAATGPGGLAAVSTGVDYCILLLKGSTRPHRVCREWSTPPSSSLRKPTTEQIGSLGNIGVMLEKIVTNQTPAPQWSSIEELSIDTRGQLWVRRVDSTYHFHPFWLQQLPELRPAVYTWDVFDENGKLAKAVELPSHFSPLIIGERFAIGTMVQEDGTLMIVRMPLS